MTKRDFEAIAKIISELRNDSLYSPFDRDKCKWIDSRNLVSDLCDYFQRCNPRFDDVKFISACQMEVENDISDSNRSVSPLV